MTKVKSLIAALALGTLGIGTSHAAFTFSNVALTSDSLTFTIDGDMSGYAPPTGGYDTDFSIQYVSGFDDIFTFTANSWSQSVFDNKAISSYGNTGKWVSDFAYSWSSYTSGLSDATATDRVVTLTTPNHLDVAKFGTLNFVWGLGNTAYASTVLGSVRVGSPVPEPETYGMLMAGLALLGAMARRSRK